jgi:cytidylate kinase
MTLFVGVVAATMIASTVATSVAYATSSEGKIFGECKKTEGMSRNDLETRLCLLSPPGHR